MKINGIVIKDENKFRDDMLNIWKYWKWQALPENKNKDKCDWYGYEKIKNLGGAFCKYFPCNICPLFDGFCSIKEDYTKIYWRWEGHKLLYGETCHGLAGLIADKIENCLKEWGIL